MNISFLRRTLSAALFFYAAMSNAEPTTVTSVTPSLIQVKRAEKLTVELANATPESRISVHPGGPYILSTLALPTTGTALVLDATGVAWVGMADGLIGGYSTGGSNAFSAQGQLKLSAAITGLALRASTLLATTADGVLYSLDLSKLTEIRELSRLALDGKPTSMAAEANNACIVLDEKSLLALDFAEGGKARVASRLDYSDPILSVAAHAGKCLVGTAHNGVVEVQQNSGRRVFPTTGPVNALHKGVDHWLSVDGVIGLSLFNGASAEKLRWQGSYNRIDPARLLANVGTDVLVADEAGVLTLIDIRNAELPLLISEFRLPSSATAIGFQGRRGFALSGKNLFTVDFSADAAPLISPLGINLGGSRRSFIEQGLLYVADWFSGLHIYDISNPQNIHHLTTFHTTGSPKGVLVHDGVAYVADDDHGLQLLDVSNPLRPQQIATLALPGLAYTLKRVDTLLYVASHRGGLHIIDIAEPRQPKLLGSFDTAGKSWAVDILDHYAYVADDANGVLVLDIENPRNPRLVGEFNPGGTAEDIVIRNGLAYVTFFDKGLFVLDLASRTTPRVMSHIDIAGNARGIVLRDQTAFIAAWQAGVIAIDVSQPTALKEIGQFDTAGAVWGLSVNGNNAFLMDWWGGVRVVDVTNPAAIRPVTQYQAGLEVKGLAIQRNFLYAAGGDQGVQVFDARNALNPVWANAIELNGSAHAIAPAGDYAYVAAGRGGLAVIDIKLPLEGRLVTQLVLSHHGDLLAATAKRVAVAELNGPITVVDTSLPQQPRRLLTHGLRTRSISVFEDDFWVATSDQGLLRLRSNDGASTKIDAVSGIRLVAASELGIVTVGEHGQLALSELHDQQLIIKATLTVANDMVGVEVRGNEIFLASATDGLWVISVREEQLYVSAHYPSAHLTTSVAINNNGAFLGGPNGVSSGELLPTLEIQRASNSRVNIIVPVTMPMGSYDVVTHTPGQVSSISHNAFKVGIAKAKKSSFTMEDLKRVLSQPGFEGQAPK